MKTYRCFWWLLLTVRQDPDASGPPAALVRPRRFGAAPVASHVVPRNGSDARCLAVVGSAACPAWRRARRGRSWRRVPGTASSALNRGVNKNWGVGYIG
jgi:hypothetical protein